MYCTNVNNKKNKPNLYRKKLFNESWRQKRFCWKKFSLLREPKGNAFCRFDFLLHFMHTRLLFNQRRSLSTSISLYSSMDKHFRFRSYLTGSLGSQCSQSGHRPGATESTRAPTCRTEFTVRGNIANKAPKPTGGLKQGWQKKSKAGALENFV